jgi:hypothetical protein
MPVITRDPLEAGGPGGDPQRQVRVHLEKDFFRLFFGEGRACKRRAWVRLGLFTAGSGFCGPGLVCWLGVWTSGLAQKPGPSGLGPGPDQALREGQLVQKLFKLFFCFSKINTQNFDSLWRHLNVHVSLADRVPRDP